MKISIYILFFVILNGCTPQINQTKVAKGDFLEFPINERSIITDTTVVMALQIIKTIKHDVQEQILSKESYDKNISCLLLVVMSDKGFELSKLIKIQSEKSGIDLNKKYDFQRDCENLEFPEVMLYLTNLEKDILFSYFVNICCNKKEK